MSSGDGIQGVFCLLGSFPLPYLFIPQFIYIAVDTWTPLLFVFGQNCDWIKGLMYGKQARYLKLCP